jgi:polyisoprenoid-binding protein YceI
MRLGPENGSLTVKTGRTGAAAKAGHNLVIEVTAWEATLEESSIVLTVDPTSLRVREGSGGMQALGDDDKASIAETIDDEVLKRQPIEFRSTAVQTDGDRLEVEGKLTLVGATRPLAFELNLSAGKVGGSVVVRQSDWGLTPYSTLFGTLKVVDEVTVVLDATLPDQSV